MKEGVRAISTVGDPVPKGKRRQVLSKEVWLLRVVSTSNNVEEQRREAIYAQRGSDCCAVMSTLL